MLKIIYASNFLTIIIKKLPVVLTKKIQKMLSKIDNLKHYCIIAITYSGGLRRSETLNLKINDIDFEQNQIKIRSPLDKIFSDFDLLPP